MATLVAFIGAFVAIIGLIGLARPVAVIQVIDSLLRTPRGLYVAALMRLVGGAILVLAAPSTRFPPIIWLIGLIAIVAAVGLVLVGFKRVRKLVDWWTRASTTLLRIGFLVATAFGGFLLYAGL
jgi:hypothetical protein